jgi:beta-glucosidase
VKGHVATVRVTNTSHRTGSTVAQAYLSFPRSAGEPPRQLKGYEKVTLGPGAGTVVSFRLDPAELATRGRYTLFVGSSSRDLPERASFEPDTLGRREHDGSGTGRIRQGA